MNRIERDPASSGVFSHAGFFKCFAINDTFTKIWREVVVAGGGHVAASQQSTFSWQIWDKKSRGGEGRQTERQRDRAVGEGAQRILK